MKHERLRAVAAAAAGMTVGYLLWLAAGMEVIAATPVDSWAVSGAVMLALLGLFAYVLGRRSSTRPAKLLFWWSPALPVIASFYLSALAMF